MLYEVTIADVVILLALIVVLLANLALSQRIRALADALTGERRRLEEELSRREEYVAVVARELLNPVAAIGFAAHVLEASRVGLDVSSLARGIAAEVAGARELVAGLTDAARAEAGRLHLKLEPIDLVAVVRNALGTFNPGPNHTIALESAERSLLVRGDVGALVKVVRHLVGNAVSYGRPGTVGVELAAAPNRREAIVAVRDGGPGIPEPERPLLFHKFARLSTAGGTLGAGLSLYVSRAIIDEHGGVISAEWPTDGGTRFYFTVPLATPA